MPRFDAMLGSMVDGPVRDWSFFHDNGFNQELPTDSLVSRAVAELTRPLTDLP